MLKPYKFLEIFLQLTNQEGNPADAVALNLLAAAGNLLIVNKGVRSCLLLSINILTPFSWI